MFRFTFSGLKSKSQLRDLVDFLILQNLGYPDYENWVQKSESELDSGYKKAILAFSDGELVGNLVYQPHKSLQGLLEIKNLRVDGRYRMRDFGRFMLKQVEVENSNFLGVIGDVRPEMRETIRFMEECGYKRVAAVDLYDGKKDIVVVKSFTKELFSLPDDFFV